MRRLSRYFYLSRYLSIYGASLNFDLMQQNNFQAPQVEKDLVGKDPDIEMF